MHALTPHIRTLKIHNTRRALAACTAGTTTHTQTYEHTTYAHTYILTHIHTCTYTRKHKYTRAETHSRHKAHSRHKHTQTPKHQRTTYTHIYIHTYTHTHTHTYTHTNIHTRRALSARTAGLHSIGHSARECSCSRLAGVYRVSESLAYSMRGVVGSQVCVGCQKV